MSNALMPLAFMSEGASGELMEFRGLRTSLNLPDDRRTTRRKGHQGTRRWGQRRARQLAEVEAVACILDEDSSTISPGHRLEHRLNHLGLVPGTPITVIRNSAPNPLVISVRGSRLCLGRSIASKIMVSPERPEKQKEDAGEP